MRKNKGLLWAALKLIWLEYNILSLLQFLKSGSLHDPVIDDVRDFKVCDDAMAHLGMSETERFSVFTIVASVLHLGNIGFEDNHEDTKGRTNYSLTRRQNFKSANAFNLVQLNILFTM